MEAGVISQEILISLRKIMRAIDIHSKNLNRNYGLTGPQLMVLQEISAEEQISITGLARRISLSQATVTDIINRLEKRGLVIKNRDQKDKRRVWVKLTNDSVEILKQTPPPLQEVFVKRFLNLEDWEKMMIVSAMKRVVDMMAAEEIDADPILATGHLGRPDPNASE